MPLRPTLCLAGDGNIIPAGERASSLRAMVLAPTTRNALAGFTKWGPLRPARKGNPWTPRRMNERA
jgi:hypothetical protein